MYEVPIDMLKSIPALRSIPGKYSFEATSYTERFTLVDPLMALLAASFWAKYTSSHTEAARPLAENPQETFMFFMNIDRYRFESASRFMSAVHAPCVERAEEATQ